MWSKLFHYYKDRRNSIEFFPELTSLTSRRGMHSTTRVYMMCDAYALFSSSSPRHSFPSSYSVENFRRRRRLLSPILRNNNNNTTRSDCWSGKRIATTTTTRATRTTTPKVPSSPSLLGVGRGNRRKGTRVAAMNIASERRNTATTSSESTTTTTSTVRNLRRTSRRRRNSQRHEFVPLGTMAGRGKPEKFATIKVRVFNSDNPGGMDADQQAPSSLSSTATRLGRALGGIFKSASKRVKRNFNRIPIALIALLVGVALTAFFPHPESPGDAFITFTIVTLGEFLSSILYSEKNQGGFLRWAKYGESVPILLNAFKIGVFYGLFIDAFKVGS